MKSNQAARGLQTPAMVNIAGLLGSLLVLLFSAILTVTIATESNTAAANGSVAAVAGAASIVKLLPLVFLTIGIIGVVKSVRD